MDPINNSDPSGRCFLWIPCSVYHWIGNAAGNVANWVVGAVHTVGGITAGILTKCGVGALKQTLGVGGGVITVNLMKKGAGAYLIRKAGGAWFYILQAAAGCIANQ